MNIKEALEEFNFFNEGDYITKNMSIAKDVVLTAYEQKCNYIKENEIYKKNLFNSYEEKCKELEKEKKKNKELSSQIDEHVYNGCDYELCNKKWAGKIDNIITQLKEMQGYIFFEKDVIDILQSIKEE